MTRIDMTTREWHELVKPVLPHTAADADVPELGDVRIEVRRSVVYAVASDRYTLGAERLQLKDWASFADAGPIHVHAGEVKASLGLFAHSKDYDPPLRITIDKVPFPVTVAGTPSEVQRLAVTLQSDDGTRLVLHDHRDQSRDHLAPWRKHHTNALRRPMLHQAPALYLHAAQFGRWAAACRKGERVAMFTGAEGDELVLVAAEKHFLGVWKPLSYLDGPAQSLRESPWHDELLAGEDWQPDLADAGRGFDADQSEADHYRSSAEDGGGQ